MQITGLETFSVWNGSRFHTVVVVDTDEGLTGLGESGIVGRELAGRGAVEHFADLLVGQDPARIEYLWQQMTRGGFFPPGAVEAGVISAIDIALWDIKGQALGVPVFELFGGRVRDHVDCYTHCHAPPGSALVDVCLEKVREGWRYLRLELGVADPQAFEPRAAVSATVAALAEVRAAVGDDIELLVDVHTRLSPADARLFLAEVETLRLFFVEDPIRSESPQALRGLRAHSRVPLAVGEQYTSKHAFRQVIEEELADFARIDVCVVGGLTEARKVAGWCETHYIDVATHNPLGPVSTAACLQLNLALPNFAVHEQPFVPGGPLADVFPEQPHLSGGRLAVPTRPGLGVTLDREAARAHDLKVVNLPRIFRPDGTPTNW